MGVVYMTTCIGFHWENFALWQAVQCLLLYQSAISWDVWILVQGIAVGIMFFCKYLKKVFEIFPYLADAHINRHLYFLISGFRRVLNIVCVLLGISPASVWVLPTFLNPLSVPSSRTLEDGTVGRTRTDARDIPKRTRTIFISCHNF